MCRKTLLHVSTLRSSSRGHTSREATIEFLLTSITGLDTHAVTAELQIDSLIYTNLARIFWDVTASIHVSHCN